MDLTESYMDAIPSDLRGRYELRETRNASQILAATNPQEFSEILEVLGAFTLVPSDIIEPGKNKSLVARRLDREFRERGWREGRHDTIVRSVLRIKPYAEAAERGERIIEREVLNEGYKVDNVKGRVALDVEWNAKDGNLDRDVGAYRALYEAGIIDAGVILTRTMHDLRDLGRRLGREGFVDTSTTTNLSKLLPRMTRGDTGGCPLLAVAITARCFVDDLVR